VGDLKPGDSVIITDILTSNQKLRKLVTGGVFTIVKISHPSYNFYPFYVQIGDGFYWTNGIPYSPLIVELL
jgi:hypothetical protein